MSNNNDHKGYIFNIQRYSIHDGPGIRTTVFMKGCPLRCFWCQNPESQKMMPELFLYRDKCTGCGQCVSACQTGAAELAEQVASVDRNKCIVCGNCVDACLNEARKIVGSYVTVDEVMSEVLRDRAFYSNSGGGVTLSGGEPTFQPDFALAILQRCRQEGLHTVLETCGYAPWATLEKLLEYVDLVLFDIKTINPEKHLSGTRMDNEIILHNAKRVAKCRPMKVRVPLVPGFNDSEDDIKALADFVKAEFGDIDIELLRYNKLWECKSAYLDRAPVRLTEQSEEYLKYLETIITPAE